MFGGYGYGDSTVVQGRLADSWLYNVTGAKWSYLGTSETVNDVTLYVSDDSKEAQNTLGGRAFASGWRMAPVDQSACTFTSDGEVVSDIDHISVLVFGGGGFSYDSASLGSSTDFRNDLWLLNVDVRMGLDPVAAAFLTVGLLVLAALVVLVVMWYTCRHLLARCCACFLGWWAEDGCLSCCCCCRRKKYSRVYAQQVL